MSDLPCVPLELDFLSDVNSVVLVQMVICECIYIATRSRVPERRA